MNRSFSVCCAFFLLFLAAAIGCSSKEEGDKEGLDTSKNGGTASISDTTSSVRAATSARPASAAMDTTDSEPAVTTASGQK